MELTKSPCCHRLCFTHAATCPHCGKAFPTGALKAKAFAEGKAFERKANALFFAAILAVPVVLLFLQFQGYLQGTP